MFHGGVSDYFSEKFLSQIKIEQFRFFFFEAAFIPISFASLQTIVSSTHTKVCKIASKIVKQQQTIALNLSGADVVKKHFKEIVQLLPFVNYLFGKQKEFFILAENLGWKVFHFSYFSLLYSVKMFQK